MSTLVHQIRRDGFIIRLYLEEEWMEPDCDWDFQSEEERKQTLADIESGKLMWFRAHVVALRHGHELGHDYLGGCCYESIADFVREGGYFDDMVAEAVADARKTLKMLCEGERCA